jgi:hypothetical protein
MSNAVSNELTANKIFYPLDIFGHWKRNFKDLANVKFSVTFVLHLG